MSDYEKILKLLLLNEVSIEYTQDTWFLYPMVVVRDSKTNAVLGVGYDAKSYEKAEQEAVVMAHERLKNDPPR
jgi:hypothetical protein